MAPSDTGSIEDKDATVQQQDIGSWKVSAEHLHEYMKAGLGPEDAQFLYSIPKTEQDKIFHKVDWRLCPMLAVLYLVSHLDR